MLPQAYINNFKKKYGFYYNILKSDESILATDYCKLYESVLTGIADLFDIANLYILIATTNAINQDLNKLDSIIKQLGEENINLIVARYIQHEKGIL